MSYRFIQGGGQVHIRKENVPKLVCACMEDKDFVRALKAQDVKAEDVTTLEHLYEVLDISFDTHKGGEHTSFPTAEPGDVVAVVFHDDKWCGLFEDFLHAIAPLVEEGVVYFTGEDGQAWGGVLVNGLYAPTDFHTMLLEYLGDNEQMK
jgi:hypothetical protein